MSLECRNANNATPETDLKTKPEDLDALCKNIEVSLTRCLQDWLGELEAGRDDKCACAPKFYNQTYASLAHHLSEAQMHLAGICKLGRAIAHLKVGQVSTAHQILGTHTSTGFLNTHGQVTSFAAGQAQELVHQKIIHETILEEEIDAERQTATRSRQRSSTKR